jgi:ATP-dependent helicase HepA
VAKINAEVEEYRDSVLDHIRHELEALTDQVNAYFLAEIRNRELILERRRQAPPESGPVELWQGQVAALERSLSMARLNFSEATDFLQGIAAGHHLARTVHPCSILLALIADE